MNLWQRSVRWLKDDFTPPDDSPRMLLFTALFLVFAAVVFTIRAGIVFGILLLAVAVVQLIRAARKARRR